MISVIICSVNKALATQVKRNIDETIGVPYELILTDNSAAGKGICAVYNESAKAARYDILCFVHEDVLFETAHWGAIIAGYFQQDENLGIVGVAGSKYKSTTPSGWSTGLQEYDCCNILHIDKSNRRHKIFSNPDPGKKVQEVVNVDGVFICASKTAWMKSPFNETVLTGFHLYDIDFSTSVSRNFDVLVSYEIEITHLTEGGDFGNNWLTFTLRWHDVNKGLLPLSVKPVAHSEIPALERTITKKWLHRLKGERISLRHRLNWLKAARVYKYPSLLPHVMVFLLFRLYKRKPK